MYRASRLITVVGGAPRTADCLPKFAGPTSEPESEVSMTPTDAGGSVRGHMNTKVIARKGTSDQKTGSTVLPDEAPKKV